MAPELNFDFQQRRGGNTRSHKGSQKTTVGAVKRNQVWLNRHNLPTGDEYERPSGLPHSMRKGSAFPSDDLLIREAMPQRRAIQGYVWDLSERKSLSACGKAALG